MGEEGQVGAIRHAGKADEFAAAELGRDDLRIEAGLAGGHRMEILGAAGTYLSRPRQPVRRRTSTGGWMKGLPRRAKTPEQAALIAAWRRGRDEGRHFNGVDDVKAYQAEIGSEKPEEPKKRAERSK